MKATKLTAIFSAITFVILSFMIDQAYYSGDIQSDSGAGALYEFIYLIICIVIFTIGPNAYHEFRANVKNENNNIDGINKHLKVFSSVFSRIMIFVGIAFFGPMVLDIITYGTIVRV